MSAQQQIQQQRLNAVELEKFIKFLALKSTQVVVQSRLGEKIQTKCKPLASGNDWFNLVIQDHPDVAADTKRALALGQGDSILQRLPLCVEISLKTVDGDHMVLEVWSLDLVPPGGSGGGGHSNGSQQAKDKDEAADSKGSGGSGGENLKGGGPINANMSDQQTLKAAHAIYNRMGILLKSLISLTRATPAYKLSRNQCPDSYGIYYRIYVERPQVHALGEGYKQVKIGQLNTIVGALSMSVAYRTKMTITPTATYSRLADGNTIMLKSDHFRPNDVSPTQQPQLMAVKKGPVAPSAERKIDRPKDTRNVIDIDKPLRPGAFTDVGKLRQYTEDDYVLPETPPFEWLLRRTRCESTGSGGNGSVESLNRKSESPVVVAAATSPLGNGHQHNINNNSFSNATNQAQHLFFNNNNNVAAFKSLENDENAGKSPTATTTTTQSSSLSQSPIKSLLIPAPIAAWHGSSSILPSAAHPPPDDDNNLLKELNFPFASPNSHVNDLAKFYRDCYHAPPLRGLSEIQTETTTTTASNNSSSNSSANNSCSATANATAGCTADGLAIDDLSRQLEQFETSLEDYEKLVTQLGLTTSSSTTGSRSSGGLQMSN